jgi:iron complex outermembrane receptor protein
MTRLLARRKAASVLAGCMAIHVQHQALAQPAETATSRFQTSSSTIATTT